MNRRAFTGLMLALAMTVMAGTVRAGDQDFTLENKTGVAIHSVFVTPHDTDHWGHDILKKDTFPDGATAEIVFHPEAEAEDWDLKIEDKDGHAIIWHKLRLTKIHKISLHWDGKEATAVIE